MRVHILGVRGSTPSPGAQFARIGGHTSCVAIAPEGADAPTLVLDAGTGIRGLQAAARRRAVPRDARPHAPALGPRDGPALRHRHRPSGRRARLLVPSRGRRSGRPARPADRAAVLSHHDLRARGRHRSRSPSRRGSARPTIFRLEARWLPHGRGRALGFRVSDATRDARLHARSRAARPRGPERRRHPPRRRAGALPDADLLLHDAHFGRGEEEQPGRAGHSTAALRGRAGARGGGAAAAPHPSPPRAHRRPGGEPGRRVIGGAGPRGGRPARGWGCPSVRASSAVPCHGRAARPRAARPARPPGCSAARSVWAGVSGGKVSARRAWASIAGSAGEIAKPWASVSAGRRSAAVGLGLGRLALSGSRTVMPWAATSTE